MESRGDLVWGGGGGRRGVGGRGWRGSKADRERGLERFVELLLGKANVTV